MSACLSHLACMPCRKQQPRLECIHDHSSHCDHRIVMSHCSAVTGFVGLRRSWNGAETAPRLGPAFRTAHTNHAAPSRHGPCDQAIQPEDSSCEMMPDQERASHGLLVGVAFVRRDLNCQMFTHSSALAQACSPTGSQAPSFQQPAVVDAVDG